jgi:hypothetical protein
MLQYNQNESAMPGSTPRYKVIEAWLEANAPHIGKETVRGILTKEYPEGCCCPYYAYGVGTLWSMIFDVSEGVVEVCFGAPTHNPWQSFTPQDGSIGMREYSAKFPSKIAYQLKLVSPTHNTKGAKHGRSVVR